MAWWSGGRNDLPRLACFCPENWVIVDPNSRGTSKVGGPTSVAENTVLSFCVPGGDETPKIRGLGGNHVMKEPFLKSRCASFDWVLHPQPGWWKYNSWPRSSDTDVFRFAVIFFFFREDYYCYEVILDNPKEPKAEYMLYISLLKSFKNSTLKPRL